MWSREDIAWAAGVIEGEGWIGTHSRRPGPGRPRYYSPGLRVHMTDLDIIERLQRLFGVGSVTFRTRRQPHWKDQHNWGVHAFEEWQAVIAAIWPWLGERRKQQVLTAVSRMATYRANYRPYKSKRETYVRTRADEGD